MAIAHWAGDVYAAIGTETVRKQDSTHKGQGIDNDERTLVQTETEE